MVLDLGVARHRSRRKTPSDMLSLFRGSGFVHEQVVPELASVPQVVRDWSAGMAAGKRTFPGLADYVPMVKG